MRAYVLTLVLAIGAPLAASEVPGYEYARAGYVATIPLDGLVTPIPDQPMRVVIVGEHTLVVENFAWDPLYGDTHFCIGWDYQLGEAVNSESPSRIQLDLPPEMSMNNHNMIGIDFFGMYLYYVFEATPCNDPADFDTDGDIDQSDFGFLQTCLTGSDVSLIQGVCESQDLDADGDVDQADYDRFRSAVTGPSVPVGLSCNMPYGPIFQNDGFNNDPTWPTIGGYWPINLQPGQTRQFHIYRDVCCYLPDYAISTRGVQWSVDPPEAGTIDGNGLLRVSRTAPSGQVFTVRATFDEPEPLVMEATVGVYDPDLDPLVGTYWRETSAVRCPPAVGTIPGEIGEIFFAADGTFGVTWEPFETYVDYRGTYTYDPATGRLIMQITHGIYIPPATDLDGWVEVRPDGSLFLDSIYFGPSQNNPNATPTCGSILE